MSTATGPVPQAAVLCVGVLQLFEAEPAPVVALRNVDLEVAPGELVAVLGPSGSGKSTLLALLAGLLRPTAGKVLVAGHDLGALDDRRLRALRSTALSLVLQDPLRNLLPYATPLDNAAFARRGARSRGGRLPWGAADLLEGLGLAPLMHTPVHRLSGGEQQRVALAAGLSTAPEVLLVDEPTSQLDHRSRDEAVDLLIRANEHFGTTIVVVTHDDEVAARLPRTVGIRDGRVGTEGRRGRQLAVVGQDGTVTLSPDALLLHPPGTLLEVRLTHEHLELWPDRGDGS